MPDPTKYVLLPRTGLTADTGPAGNMLRSLPVATSMLPPETGVLAATDGSEHRVTVIDSIQENGPKLVELTPQTADSLNDPRSPVRAVPLIEYGRPNPHLQPLAAAVLAAAAPVAFNLTDAVSGVPVSDVTVVAFTNFAAKQGASGTTGPTGAVALQLSGNTIERLYCYPPGGYWGAYRANLSIQPNIAISIEPVSLAYTDGVRHFYGSSQYDPTTGVVVGVMDTGVGPHTDLNVVGGRNTVTGELAADFLDGDTHGTHVAGLIGSNGGPPTGLRGLAPNIPINAYRVFPVGAGATNYAILKAMIFAGNDRCDIINLSLGGGPFDDIVDEAVADARNQGMLVIVAAGNDGRGSVNFPAAYTGSTAVSAMGLEGTFPAGSLEEGEILRPPASPNNPGEFLAGFSNVGPAIDVVGVGVGTLSTLPGNAHGPMSGTSMAAPVVAGATACLLSRDPWVWGMPRDRARSDAIERLLQSHCVRRGFGLAFEGYGLPDPAAV